MPDIFRAYDRDSDEPDSHYEVMEQRGTFWYYSGSFGERADAEEAARRFAREGAVIIDYVTRVPVLRIAGAVLDTTAE